MKIFSNININLRLQLTVTLLIFVLLGAAAYTLQQSSIYKANRSIENQATTYLDQLSALVQEVEKQTNANTPQHLFATLKPHFNRSVFYQSDLPFIIDNQGNYIIHLYKEGQRFPYDKLHHIASSKQGSLEYIDYINGKKHNVRLFYKTLTSNGLVVALPISIQEAHKELTHNGTVLFFIIIALTSLVLIATNLFFRPISKALEKIGMNLQRLSHGEDVEEIIYKKGDEVGALVASCKNLTGRMDGVSSFAYEISQNNLSVDFQVVDEHDTLGNSLLVIRNSMIEALSQEEKRKEEEEKRNWFNVGLAKFADILRLNNDNLERLADTVNSHLLEYLGADLGALFIANDDQKEKSLELISAFAYSKKKHNTKTIAWGEGLIGNCAIEKSTIYLKEIPEGYIEITSGLGEANPRNLLIVPLKLDDTVFGIIEIASFSDIEAHEIEFVEKIAENIASTLSSVKNSIRTAQLLEQSQQQSEEMLAQEEEMRQNMEEMQATQEEMSRKSIELESMKTAINETMLYAELDMDGTIVVANNNIISLTGYNRSELEGNPLSAIIHPESVHTFRKQWESIRSGNFYQGVQKWQSHTGEDIYVLCGIAHQMDESGAMDIAYLFAQNITDTKRIEIMAQQQAEEIERNLVELQMEQEFSEQQQKDLEILLLALEEVSSIVQIDSSGFITYANGLYANTLGSTKEEIEGVLHAEIDPEAKKNPTAYTALWEQLMAGQSQQRTYEVDQKNETLWLREKLIPIPSDDGKVSSIIAIGTDITESKETERKLHKQIDELINQRKNK